MTAYVLLLILASQSDVDADTSARHERAGGGAPSSEPVVAPSGEELTVYPAAATEAEYASATGVPVTTRAQRAAARISRPSAEDSAMIELELRPRLELAGLGSAGGGKIEHQEGPGGALSFELGFPFIAVGEDRRAGLVWHVEAGLARLLDRHRPAGADWASTLDLMSLQGALLFRYELLGDFADVGLSAGPGFVYLRAFERFTDGTPDLDTTLAAGIAFWPMVRVDLHDGVLGGRVFGEASAVVANAQISGLMSEYDSLISGLSRMMVTPRVAVGQMWSIAGGLELGACYQAELVAGSSLGHAFSLAARWGSN